jgi:cytochrome c peroxidase
MTTGALLTALALLGPASSAAAPPCLGDLERLGKLLFFDPQLSVNGNQSCSSCHALHVGTTGPHSAINATVAAYEGSVPGRFGDRKPPTAGYAGDSPVLSFDEAEGVWVGGMFWDGRATGKELGDPLAEQALGPFLNPVEQALPTPAAVASRACRHGLFRKVWGAAVCRPENAARAFENVGRSIAAYERSREVTAFTSKYDAYLAGAAPLSDLEQRGLELFEGRGRCSECHPSRPGPDGKPPVFTDFTYDNLGFPRNLLDPSRPGASLAADPTRTDPGLGGFLRSAGHPQAVWERELGKFKVPTLRNVDQRPGGLASGRFVKAYGHNGVFKSLEEVVHFYNTRDVEPWPAPEHADTVNREELGDLGLGAEDEAALVAFLATLTDGYLPPRCR